MCVGRVGDRPYCMQRFAKNRDSVSDATFAESQIIEE